MELWNRRGGASKFGTLQELDDPKLMLPTSPLGGSSITSPERIRSPSCNKGKTARDFEEELTCLRKENFDLKMRVYVLNEQMELFQNVDNADQLYEVNSNLKQEVEKLKAELSEKDELVLKAGEAMNLLSAKHRDDVAALKMELQEQCSSLQDMNLRLEQEVERLMSQHNMTSSQMGPGMEDSSTQYALAFAPLGFNKAGGDITNLEEQLSEKLKIIEDNDRIIEEYDEMVKKGKLREKELEEKLKSMSESLSGLTQEIREKENHRLQIVKKACELEEYVSLKQLEVDKLQKMLIAKPTHEDMREIRNKYECCTTENNVLINRITELENKLDEVESKKFEYEAVQEKAKCSTCRQYRNVAELLERTQAQLGQTEVELEQAKKDQFNTVKALQGCLKANKALTADIETLNKQIKSCGCTDPKIPQKEWWDSFINVLLSKHDRFKDESFEHDFR
uniref:Centrosomin N-terminal motif 1 domain-containing protein n=1 Tax=Lygus hesperus TaxID=30085 RepID=A0A0K8SUI2_LYGHE